MTGYPGGEVQYSFRMFAVFDQPILCPTTHPRVTQCVIQKLTADPHDPEWRMDIRFGPVESIEEVDELGKELSDDFFSRLAISLRVRIDNVRMTGHSLTPLPNGGGIAHIILPMPTVAASGRVGGATLQPDQLQLLHRVFSMQPSPEIDSWIALYRSAMSAVDPVVKFLIFYLLLLEIAAQGGQMQSQPAVDRLIMSLAPSTARTPGPKGPETTFTRLRNEVGHRGSVRPESTRAEIANHLDEFHEIVHSALKAKV